MEKAQYDKVISMIFTVLTHAQTCRVFGKENTLAQSGVEHINSASKSLLNVFCRKQFHLYNEHFFSMLDEASRAVDGETFTNEYVNYLIDLIFKKFPVVCKEERRPEIVEAFGELKKDLYIRIPAIKAEEFKQFSYLSWLLQQELVSMVMEKNQKNAYNKFKLFFKITLRLVIEFEYDLTNEGVRELLNVITKDRLDFFNLRNYFYEKALFPEQYAERSIDMKNHLKIWLANILGLSVEELLTTLQAAYQSEQEANLQMFSLFRPKGPTFKFVDLWLASISPSGTLLEFGDGLRRHLVSINGGQSLVAAEEHEQGVEAACAALTRAP